MLFRSSFLGHLTGRLLLRREPYAVDVARVVDAAIAHRVCIELNGTPERLDMDWRHWRRAAARGLLCVVTPDAHDTEGLLNVRHGVRAARKGWLTAGQVLNTRDLAGLLAWLGGRRAAP